MEDTDVLDPNLEPLLCLSKSGFPFLYCAIASSSSHLTAKDPQEVPGKLGLYEGRNRTDLSLVCPTELT